MRITLKPARRRASNQLRASQAGFGSCSDCDSLNADELQSLLRRAFDFEIQANGLPNALVQLASDLAWV